MKVLIDTPYGFPEAPISFPIINQWVNINEFKHIVIILMLGDIQDYVRVKVVQKLSERISQDIKSFHIAPYDRDRIYTIPLYKRELAKNYEPAISLVLPTDVVCSAYLIGE